MSDNPKEFQFLLPAEPCYALGLCETGRLLKTANSLQVGKMQPNRHVIPAAIFSHPVCRHLPGGQTIAPYPHLMQPVITLVTETKEDTSLTLARRPHKRIRLTNSFCGHEYTQTHKHTHAHNHHPPRQAPAPLFAISLPAGSREAGPVWERGGGGERYCATQQLSRNSALASYANQAEQRAGLGSGSLGGA